ncbi:MAG: hypothetical protein FWE12_08140 [Oscillospiraceae bacterium]|nr:hypothetical protein [Oscillospiraceae bacterium]
MFHFWGALLSFCDGFSIGVFLFFISLRLAALRRLTFLLALKKVSKKRAFSFFNFLLVCVLAVWFRLPAEEGLLSGVGVVVLGG